MWKFSRIEMWDRFFTISRVLLLDLTKVLIMRVIVEADEIMICCFACKQTESLPIEFPKIIDFTHITKITFTHLSATLSQLHAKFSKIQCWKPMNDRKYCRFPVHTISRPNYFELLEFVTKSPWMFFKVLFDWFWASNRRIKN